MMVRNEHAHRSLLGPRQQHATSCSWRSHRFTWDRQLVIRSLPLVLLMLILMLLLLLLMLLKLLLLLLLLLISFRCIWRGQHHAAQLAQHDLPVESGVRRGWAPRGAAVERLSRDAEHPARVRRGGGCRLLVECVEEVRLCASAAQRGDDEAVPGLHGVVQRRVVEQGVLLVEVGPRLDEQRDAADGVGAHGEVQGGLSGVVPGVDVAGLALQQKTEDLALVALRGEVQQRHAVVRLVAPQEVVGRLGDEILRQSQVVVPQSAEQLLRLATQGGARAFSAMARFGATGSTALMILLILLILEL